MLGGTRGSAVSWAERRTALRRVAGISLAAGAAWAGCLVAAGTALATAPVLTQVPGSPVSVGSNPASVAFSPSGRLLAAANNADNTVSVFSVAPDGTGQLSAVVGSPFGTGPGPVSVAFSPSGGLLAVANSNQQTYPYPPGTVSVFAVGSNGALTEVAGSPFTTGIGPTSLAFNPSGQFLAVANGGDSTVSVFSVGSGGGLTQVSGSPFATGTGPAVVEFSPSGGLLATVSSMPSGSVSVFSVGSDGTLSQVSGSPFATGSYPDGMAFSPSGQLLAVANDADNTVSLFSVGAGGDLTQTQGSPFGTGANPTSVAFNPSGQLLAAASPEDSDVWVYSVGSGGALSQISGSPLGVDNAGSVAFSPDGGLLTAVDSGGQGSVWLFSVGPPSAGIYQPARNGNYTLGQTVATRFSCADATYAPGIASCRDSLGATAGHGRLDTSRLGHHTYTVTAVSRDGQTRSTDIGYTVFPRQAVSPMTSRTDVVDGRAKIGLACRGGVPKSVCHGTLLLTARRRIVRSVNGHRQTTITTVAAGHESYALETGTSQTLTIPISRAAMKLLEARRDHQLPVQATTSTGGGLTVRGAVTLLGPFTIN